MDLLRTLWTHKEYDYEYAPYLYEWLGYIHILLLEFLHKVVFQFHEQGLA